jgi:D-alanyl-lipoteichoic acid acyltransferase DltB (MBOAT superfamily)
MIFSTFGFILVFLPIVFSLYSLCLRFNLINVAKIVLICASFIFYAYGCGDFFPFFVASVFLNYAIGISLARTFKKAYKKVILVIGLVLNITLLGYYKYTDFLIFNLNVILESPLPYKEIILPIGISFFTFQLIAFLVDSYRGETKGYNLIDYLLFITFFPQLIVGPIVHHKDVVPQYRNMSKHMISSDLIAPGLFLFAIGCAKKLALADPMTIWAQNAFDNALQLNMLESWVASLTYTLSYYFDLSGYADMAIGLGMVFGVMLPMNFNSPYKARNFADYWRRWHITLSKFLGSYIFRNIYKKEKGNINFYWALFVTFLISGFWHGAGWTFVVWGIANGIFVIAAHAMRINNLKLPFLIAWIMTFIGVIGTRTLFVADDFTDAWYVLNEFYNFSSFTLLGNSFIALKQPVYILLSLFIVLSFPNSHQMVNKFKPNNKFLLATVILMLIAFLNMSYVRGFLYFQF